MALTKISHDDNDKAVFGTSEDLKIFHDGSNSYIEEDGAGQIIIRGWGPRLQAGYSPTSSRNTGEDAVVCVTDGAVELYYNAVKKLETTSSGVLIPQNNLTIRSGSIAAAEIGLQDESSNATHFYISSKNNGTVEYNCYKGGVGTKYPHVFVGYTTEYGRLDNTGWKLGDSRAIRLGDSQDLDIYHTGSHGYLENDTGNLFLDVAAGNDIRLRANDENIIWGHGDGAVELYHNGTEMFYTSASGCHVGSPSAAAHLHFLDSGICRFGTGNDLQIYHDHSNTRNRIDNYGVNFHVVNKNTDGAVYEEMVIAKPNAAVELYYDNVMRIDTTSYGARCTGNLVSTGNIKAETDGGKLLVGAGEDLKIYHSSGINFIQGANSANIYACADDFAVLNQAGTKTAIWCNSGGSTDLFYNNAKKFETNSSGAQVTGSLVADSVAVGDGEFLLCGNDDDLKIDHNDTNATIQNNKGVLYIHNNDTGTNKGVCILNDYFWVNNEANTENIITAQANGAVNLYNDGVKRLETWASGVKTFGTYFETNNVTTYSASFYQQNNQTYSYDIDVGSEGGAGNSFWLVCGYNHYYNTAYGAHRVGMFSARTTSVDTIFHDNQTSGNAGSWSVSKPNNSTFRVTKSAGSYSGWGHGFVQLTFRKI